MGSYANFGRSSAKGAIVCLEPTLAAIRDIFGHLSADTDRRS